MSTSDPTTRADAAASQPSLAEAPAQAVAQNSAVVQALLGQLPSSLARTAETMDASRQMFHKIGNWGTANVLKLNQDVNRVTAMRLGGAGGGMEGMTPADLAGLMESIPFGSTVNVTNIGNGANAAQDPTGTSPTPVNPASGGPAPVSVNVPGTSPTRRPAAQPTPEQDPPAVQPVRQPIPVPPEQAPKAPAYLNGTTKTIAIALVSALAAGGVMGMLLGRGPTPATPPNTPRVIDGIMEVEIPIDVNRRSDTSDTTDSQSGFIINGTTGQP